MTSHIIKSTSHHANWTQYRNYAHPNKKNVSQVVRCLPSDFFWNKTTQKKNYKYRSLATPYIFCQTVSLKISQGTRL